MKCIDRIANIGCGRQVDWDEFLTWDKLTQQEFWISGLCTECQDIVFAEPEEDGDWESDPGFDWDKMTSLSQYQQEEDFLKGA